MRAVFVDGFGRTHEMETEGQPIVIYPVPERRKTAVGRIDSDASAATTREWRDARFVRIGALSDGRLVYTLSEAKLSLWQWSATSDRSLGATIRKSISDRTQRELDDFMSYMGLPVVVLFDKIEPVDRSSLEKRHVEGVGRRM